MAYNFKTIETIPPASSLVDIVLSKTQRKTPTEVHNGFHIQRIRRFYMRKVKFTQQTLHEKLTLIIDAFPKLEDLHPFYADLMNVLYDKDHYKIALGQLGKARSIADSIAKDYVRMMKYADSLYRCKMLKRAALGRMCTILKKLSPSFGYLEEVRKHLARLPSIDPNARTLIITGFPNVGKSSLMNNLTKAKVDVQPYPFTTQSLFVGHMQYNYVPWQVLDTPGILDHPLEQRNTIEMQAITALAHLNACVLFLMDISESCGYSLSHQISLFNSIKPLFKGKPIVVVLTKTDLKKYEDVPEDTRKEIEAIGKENSAYIISMSNKNGEGVRDVKTRACEILLEHRLIQKGENASKLNSIQNRVHIAAPQKRDNKERPPCIPESVLAERAKMKGEAKEENLGESTDKRLSRKKNVVKEMQDAAGGAGVFYVPWEKHFILEDEDWRWDAPPEIFEGHNVADFIDPDIDKKLANLDKEEAILEKMDKIEIAEKSEDELLNEEEYKKVQGKKRILKDQRKMKLKNLVKNKARVVEKVKEEFKKKGIEGDTLDAQVRKRATLVDKIGKRKNPDTERMEDIDEVDVKRKAKNKEFDMALSRTTGMCIAKSEADRLKNKIERKNKVKIKEPVYSSLPKHLNSGKMGLGTRNKR